MKQEERAIAALVHLIIIIPLWGILFAGVVWMLYKERNREVVFHAVQAIFFQSFFLLIFLIYLIFRLFSYLVMVIDQKIAASMTWGNNHLLFVCGVAYVAMCIFGALRIALGSDFRYPVIGRKVKKIVDTPS